MQCIFSGKDEHTFIVVYKGRQIVIRLLRTERPKINFTVVVKKCNRLNEVLELLSHREK